MVRPVLRDANGVRINGRLGTARTTFFPKSTKYGAARVSNLKGYDSMISAFTGVLAGAQIIAVHSSIKAQWLPEVGTHQKEMSAYEVREAKR